MRIHKASFALLLWVFALFGEKTSGLGKIEFPTTATPRAQNHFLEGVLLLHNFEYERARKAFQGAEREEPSFALAFWGEAMTLNHPLWNEQDLPEAKRVLAKLGVSDLERVEKAKSDKEKGYIKAINILYSEGDKGKRDRDYAEAMRQLATQYPEDDEAALFYALALLGTTEGVRDNEIYMEAAALAEGVLQQNPEHPGALHYAIHSYDDPAHAPLGLRAARVYGAIAPDSAHALHMPAHIFLALGMWGDVVRSNLAAWKAAENHSIHDYHALLWLLYGYLQQGQYKQAHQLIDKIGRDSGKEMNAIGKYYYGLMRSAYFVESQDWNSDLQSINLEGIDPKVQASALYAEALRSLSKGNSQEVRLYLSKLEKLSRETDELAVKITFIELQAELLAVEGKKKEAIFLLQKAAELDDTLPVGYGPPLPIKPLHELLADILYQDKQYQEAYKEYLRALKRAPNRFLATLGLKKSEEKLHQLGIPVPEKISPYFNKLILERRE